MFDKIKNTLTNTGSKIGSSAKDIGGKVTEKTSKVKEQTFATADDALTFSKTFITDNKNLIIQKVKDNKAANLLVNKKTFLFSIGVISGIIYAILPFPIRILISEAKFENFCSKNAEFLADLLVSEDNTEEVS